MATSDGMTEVWWLATPPASPTAPTTTELGAGVKLASFIAPDGLDMGFDQDRFEDSTLAGTWKTEDGGKKSSSPEIQFRSDCKSDTPWTTFATEGEGYLYVREGVSVATAATAAQKLHGGKYKSGVRKVNPTAENEPRGFSISFMLRGEYIQDAAVAAGGGE